MRSLAELGMTNKWKVGVKNERDETGHFALSREWRIEISELDAKIGRRSRKYIANALGDRVAPNARPHSVRQKS